MISRMIKVKNKEWLELDCQPNKLNFRLIWSTLSTETQHWINCLDVLWKFICLLYVTGWLLFYLKVVLLLECTLTIIFNCRFQLPTVYFLFFFFWVHWVKTATSEGGGGINFYFRGNWYCFDYHKTVCWQSGGIAAQTNKKTGVL